MWMETASPMIAIVDYRAGNLTSVELAVRHLGFDCRVTQDPRVVREAERIIFPGVGAAGRAMGELRRMGLDHALRESYKEKKPILGICLGAQIILEESEEDGARCLGFLPGRVRRFPQELRSPSGERLKIPHMGWNGVRRGGREHPVLKGWESGDEFYFVHSFYPDPVESGHVVGWTDYGIAFPSIIGTGSLVATQFHPEKSGRSGLRLLQNFCQWDGAGAE